jgi:formylglycine-generating enzyme required for sulfatase activity
MMKIETKEIKLIKLPDTLKIHVAENQMTWKDAMDYAESIGMRLPTKFELQVIAESTDEFNDLGWVWSASTRSNIATYARYVYLLTGTTYSKCKTLSGSVLCVSP